MRGIDQLQLRATDTELDLIAAKESYRAANPLSVYQGAVKALQISQGKAFTIFADFGVTSRNDRRGRIDDHLAFGIAPQAGHFAFQFNPSNPACGRIG